MDEKLVQWVLSKDLPYFSEILNIPIDRCLGTEVTTKYGRVDFMLRVNDNRLLIVELETSINNSAKLVHCTEQILRYIKLKKQYQYRSTDLDVALVYAKDTTPKKFVDELEKFAIATKIILKTYSLQKIFTRYNKMVNQLNYTSGISLGRAIALGVTSIAWLNKFMLPFLDTDIETDVIPWEDLKHQFSSNTNFYVLKRLVEDFELVEIKNKNKKRLIALTEHGCRFRDELYTQISIWNPGNSTKQNILKELTVGQKRLLLEILLNGNFTKLKINILHFLRFVHLTEGAWLPKQGMKLTRAEIQYLNNMFNSSYNSRTLKDLILQTCTFCEELELVQKLPAPDQVYDKVMFTSLGSRVNNHFEQLLHVERERYQIPLQIGEGCGMSSEG